MPADITRLTLDTIGLCGFDYRFNWFYRERLHPFVEAMDPRSDRGLGRASDELPIAGACYAPARTASSTRDIELDEHLVDQIIGNGGPS